MPDKKAAVFFNTARLERKERNSPDTSNEEKPPPEHKAEADACRGSWEDQVQGPRGGVWCPHRDRRCGLQASHVRKLQMNSRKKVQKLKRLFQ